MIAFTQARIHDVGVIQEVIFIDLGCLMSFIDQSFRFPAVYRFPKVASMKKKYRGIIFLDSDKNQLCQNK